MAIHRNKLGYHSLSSSSSEELAKEVHDLLSPEMNKNASVQSVIARFKLRHIAGNVYECPSTKDFWEVKNGRILKLVESSEVDNGEKMIPVDRMDPESNLQKILDDLEF